MTNVRTVVLAGLAAALLSLSTAAQTSIPLYDIVIRNGQVLDGAGNPAIRADVAIRNGRFVRIGLIPAQGRKEIDAAGKYVSPGWIDMMDQSGSTLLKNGRAENKVQAGVTTAIGGEGGTPVPAERVSEYFSTLERQGISINFGTYFSESQARVAIVGRENRPPNADELAKMKAIMEQAMEAGAMGMTTALIYPPSSYAGTAELIEVAKSAAKYGGIYASHIRGEGKEVVTAVEEAIEIGEKAGLPVEIFHLKVAYSPAWGTLMHEIGRRVEDARRRGLDVAADLYVYTAGGTGLEATIPSWAHEGGRQELLKRLADPTVRDRLKTEIRTGSPGWWNIIEAAGGWDRIVLVNANNAANARFEGKHLADIAREMGKDKDPADAAFDLVAQGEGRVMAVFHMMSEPDIEQALRFPWTSIGSDAGTSLTLGQADAIGLPHPRAYGNFPRVIARYVRERQVLTLPDAIRKMTSWPATRMRLTDRGLIREGLWADVVVFDLEKIQDRATYEQPYLSPEGIEWVLVNGEVVIEGGRHTGARPGKVLYGPGRQIAQQQASATRSILTVPIDVTIPKPPTPASADGKTHLVYELNITNLDGAEGILDRVTVLAGDESGRELAAYEGQILVDAVARPGMPALRGPAKLSIGAGQRALVYVWVTIPGDLPVVRSLHHRIAMRVGDAQQPMSTDAARLTLTGRPKVIAPPLRGGGWLAGNGPSNASGHRRAVLPVDGRARIPQRFGIDWLQIGPDGSRYAGDPKDNKNYRCYGQEALAVADGVVSGVKDGIPENVPGPTSRAVPITLDTAGGNYVIVNLGDGIYAFYAHLQPGSLRVKVGDKVRRGQVLGLVGNSGNSTEPHLHFHLSDADSPLGGEGIPYALTMFRVEGTATTIGLGNVPWTPLPAPEPRKMEIPLQNVVVRFSDR
ncbi:MAG TPA: amidohydrolase family protein [Vicinamibacterales bacterium]|nr:amidohydrolase family protein [Vicinamibacterales bacterium]